MINTPVNPKQFEFGTLRINCGDEFGSGFIVAKNQILTARHVIIDHITDDAPINLFYREKDTDPIVEVPGSLTFDDEDLDIAIIAFEGDSFEQMGIPLYLTWIRYNQEWETFGFPYSKSGAGGRFYGTITNFNRDLPYDITLFCKDIQPNFDYSGLSGSPLIINGKAVGFTTWSTVRGLGAVSVQKVHGFLSEHDIEFVDDIEEAIPEEFLTELENTIPNSNVFEDLTNKINAGGKYYLLYGPPGSGKSVIATTFTADPDKFTICGRYIIRMPGDTQPIFVKSSRDNFLLWMEDLVSKELSGQATAKDNLTIEQRIERLAHWLKELSDHFAKDGKIGIVIVDGLDEITLNHEQGGNDFLKILPDVLPPNLAVLLSCTSEDMLPVSVKNSLNAAQKAKVTPLTRDESNAFIENELTRSGLEIASAVIDSIAVKAEGLPLYLRYLLENLKSIDITEIGLWLDTLPTIDGNIKVYYETLWSSQISTDPDKYWITLTGAELRQPVAKENFVQMLPDTAKYAFSTKFSSVKHLFKGSTRISLYHNSFDIFLEEKGSLDLKNVNDNISKFNLSNQGDFYGATNLLYHLLKSNDALPAITNCNQHWADRCALLHMEPDLIIQDLKQVEILSITLGLIPDFFRIKLLSQRIKFRYNNVLALNAFEITNTLIQLGQPKDAIKYILRGNLLLVSFEDAIYFLQKLYEKKAFAEADRLYIVIDSICKMMIENGLKEGGIDLQAYNIRLQAITLSINNKPYRTVMRRFMSDMLILRKIQDLDGNTPEQINDVRTIREYLSSWNLAYHIYSENLYPGIEEMKKFAGGDFDSEWAQHLAKSVIHYYNFENIGLIDNEENTANKRLIGDVEFLIENYGYRDEDIQPLIKTLLEVSSRSDILISLINKQIVTPPEFRFRKSNGVDADTDSFLELQNYNSYKAYVAASDDYPVLATRSETEWERFFTSLFEVSGYILGKAARSKADDNPAQLVEAEKQMRRLFNQMIFPLAERVKWDRSYALIEAIMPILYQRVCYFYLEFGEEKIDEVVSVLVEKNDSQFGLFTEGYRKSLLAVVSLLAHRSKHRANAHKLLALLEQHSLLAVQNRWERTPELLQIIEMYALIGDSDKSNVLYQKMLDTSMGPTWYKEDQFALINTVLRKMGISGKSHIHYQAFASYFEYASGEMTFQRYVQQEKHGFIGTMAGTGDLDQALGYFKFQLLPPAEIIKKNAESSVIDAPRKGDGYVLGARGVIEGSAMARLLENIDADPFLIVALADVFIINDDTSRYFEDFAEIQAKCLSKVAQTTPENTDILILKVVESVLNPKLKDFTYSYLKTLKEYLTEDIFLRLRQELTAKGLDEKYFPEVKEKTKEAAKEYTAEDDERMEQYGMPFPGVGKMSNFSKIPMSIQEAKDALEIGNNEGARTALLGCLNILDEGKADIWQGKGLTEELGNLFDLLKSFNTPVQLINLLNGLIIDHRTEDWRVVNTLIKLLGDKLAEDEKSKIILVVKDHIEMMIRSNGAFSEDYHWLNSIGSALSADLQLINFLIWLLNHPYESVQQRTINSLIWYAQVNPPDTLKSLIACSIENENLKSNELSAYVLSKVSKNQNKAIWALIKDNKDLQNQILNIGHFMIRSYYLEIMTTAKDLDESAQTFYKELLSLFKDGSFSGSDVYLDNDALVPIDQLIDELNSMEILNTRFCETLMDNVRMVCQPLSAIDQLRVQRYVRRSFFDEEFDIGHYDYLIRCSLNSAILDNVGIDQIEDVKLILELPVIDEN